MNPTFKDETQAQALLDALQKQDPFIFNEVFNANTYQLAEADVKDKLVIDVGANIGCFTFLALTLGAKEVLAIEPHPDNFKLLANNAKFLKNADNELQLLNRAVSVCWPNVKIQGDKGHAKTVPQNDPGDGHVVECISLAKCVMPFPTVNSFVLKIDCEGAEFGILLDANHDLMRKFCTIFIEIHGDGSQLRTCELLKHYIMFHGFRLVHCEPMFRWDMKDGQRVNILPLGTEICKFQRVNE